MRRAVKDSVGRQPAGQHLARGVGVAFYDEDTRPITTMAPEMVTIAGGDLPHDNRQP